MHIFFDMDYTILAVDNTLRPGTREVFQRLKDDGHELYIWSGMGVRWREVRQHGLEEFLSGVHTKPVSDYTRAVQEMVATGALPVTPDFVVDDYAEVASALGGMAVSAYFFRNPQDLEMERVYRIICDYHLHGGSADAAFHPPRNGR